MSDPIVVRHWRQEWRYQADGLLAYEGANTWAPREVPAAAAFTTARLMQPGRSPRLATALRG